MQNMTFCEKEKNKYLYKPTYRRPNGKIEQSYYCSKEFKYNIDEH